MEALWLAINKAKVISFDFFDTLFVRPLADPEDAFDIIGSQFNIPDFRKLRRKAQANAFQQMIKKGKKEITLSDIYDNFSNLAVSNETLMQAEYDLEKALVIPDDILFPLFTTLIDQGKKVVITSDMYFGEDFFKEVLLNYHVQNIPLFISAARNATKRDSGELFDLIVDSFDVAPQEILHIGDNLVSDVQKPREKQLAAFHYAPHSQQSSKKSLPLMSSFSEGMLRTISADKIPENSFQELGFKYQATATMGFLSWIVQQSKADKIDYVLFVSRDGYIPERVARHYFNDSLPPFSYFLGSRIVFNLAMIDEQNFDQNISFLMSGADGLAPGELLERIGLEPPLQSILTDLGFEEGFRIGPENHELVKKFLSAYRNEILKICRRNRRGLFIYLRNMNIRAGSKVALVDVGWSGTTQEAFENAVASIMDISVVGYYFCLANTLERQRRESRQEMKALITSESTSPSLVDKIYENRIVVELFFSAPHNSIIGYLPNGSNVTTVGDPGRARVKDHSDLIKLLNDGVDVFVDDFIPLQKRIGLVMTPMQQVQPLINLVTGDQWINDEHFTVIENFDSWGSTRNQTMKFADYFKR
jgi:predicted HAD superfamily hydrolase